MHTLTIRYHIPMTFTINASRTCRTCLRLDQVKDAVCEYTALVRMGGDANECEACLESGGITPSALYERQRVMFNRSLFPNRQYEGESIGAEELAEVGCVGNVQED